MARLLTAAAGAFLLGAALPACSLSLGSRVASPPELRAPRDCRREGWSGTLKGVVREHPGGLPLAGVTVSIFGLGVGATTDPDGSYRIPSPGLPSCDYSLVFTERDYTTVIADVDAVAPGDSLEVDVALTRLLAPAR
jgi:hypothetical protein